MGQSTFSMAISNSYVCLPEGRCWFPTCDHGWWIWWRETAGLAYQLDRASNEILGHQALVVDSWAIFNIINIIKIMGNYWMGLLNGPNYVSLSNMLGLSQFMNEIRSERKDHLPKPKRIVEMVKKYRWYPKSHLLPSHKSWIYHIIVTQQKDRQVDYYPILVGFRTIDTIMLTLKITATS